jgi:hypothetical protein
MNHLLLQSLMRGRCWDFYRLGQLFGCNKLPVCMLRVFKIAVFFANPLSQGLKAFLRFDIVKHCLRSVMVECMADLIHNAAHQKVICLELWLTPVSFILLLDIIWDILIR